MYLFAALKPKDWKHDTTFDRMSNENYCDDISTMTENQNSQHSKNENDKISTQ